MNALLETSPLGQLIDAFIILLSMLLVGFFMWLNWDGPFTREEPEWLGAVEVSFCVVFTLDYTARLFASEDRLGYAFSFHAMVDLVTVMPVWAQLFVEVQASHADLERVKQQYLRPLRVLRALRILRAYRLLAFSRSAIQRQMAVVALTVLSLIVCTTGIVQALEFAEDPESQEGQVLAFYDAMYYIIVTITTVGYGDIAPRSSLGRVTIMLMITSTMVLIPSQISKLSQMMAQRSVYAGSFSGGGGTGHVIVCGDVTANALAHFLREFFHADTTQANEKAVILCEKEPSYEMKRLIMGSSYDTRVRFLQGSAMLDSDLWRASADRARACFCLLDKFTDNPESADTAATLLASSVRLFNTALPTFSEVIRSENTRHVRLSGASRFVCVEQVKQGMMAMSTVMPGVPALISNLVSTFSASESALEDVREDSWMREYFTGCTNEVYAAELPESMTGLTFRHCAEIVLVECHAILIAVESAHHVEHHVKRRDLPGSRGTRESRRASTRRRSSAMWRRRNTKISMGGGAHSSGLGTASFRPTTGPGRDAPVDNKDTASDEPQLRLYPHDYIVHAGDVAMFICDHQAVAEQVSALSASKVNAYRQLQGFFKVQSRSRSTVSAGVDGDDAFSHGSVPRRGRSNSNTSIGRGARDRDNVFAAGAARVEAAVDGAASSSTTTPGLRGLGIATPNHIRGDPKDSEIASPAAAGAGAAASGVRFNMISGVGPAEVQGRPRRTGSILVRRDGPVGAGTSAHGGAARLQIMETHHESGTARVDTDHSGTHPSLMSTASSALGTPRRAVGSPRGGIGLGGLAGLPQSPSGGFGSMYQRRGAVTRWQSTWQLSAGDYFTAGEEHTLEEFVRTPPPPLTDHIVVIGLATDLADFVLPLRTRLLGKLHPIVIISPVKPTHASFGKIARAAQVYFLRGSPLSLKTLTSASVTQAKSIAILANPTGKVAEMGLKSSDNLMVDADAITCLRFIVEVCEHVDPQPHIVVELVRDSNIKFLGGIRRYFDATAASRLSDVESSDEDTSSSSSSESASGSSSDERDDAGAGERKAEAAPADPCSAEVFDAHAHSVAVTIAAPPQRPGTALTGELSAASNQTADHVSASAGAGTAIASVSGADPGSDEQVGAADASGHHIPSDAGDADLDAANTTSTTASRRSSDSASDAPRATAVTLARTDVLPQPATFVSTPPKPPSAPPPSQCDTESAASASGDERDADLEPVGDADATQSHARTMMSTNADPRSEIQSRTSDVELEVTRSKSTNGSHNSAHAAVDAGAASGKGNLAAPATSPTPGLDVPGSPTERARAETTHSEKAASPRAPDPTLPSLAGPLTSLTPHNDNKALSAMRAFATESSTSFRRLRDAAKQLARRTRNAAKSDGSTQRSGARRSAASPAHRRLSNIIPAPIPFRNGKWAPDSAGDSDSGSDSDDTDYEDGMDLADELQYVTRPSFASGRVAMSNMLDSLLGAAYRKPHTIQVVQLLLLGHMGVSNDEKDTVKAGTQRAGLARLHQMKVPKQFVDRGFIQLFGHLLREQLLAIALYRCGTVSRSPLPFMYTNPAPKTKLEAGDLVFVLGTPAKAAAAMAAEE